jgi:hypothetical protein
VVGSSGVSFMDQTISKMYKWQKTKLSEKQGCQLGSFSQFVVVKLAWHQINNINYKNQLAEFFVSLLILAVSHNLWIAVSFSLSNISIRCKYL